MMWVIKRVDRYLSYWNQFLVEWACRQRGAIRFQDRRDAEKLLNVIAKGCRIVRLRGKGEVKP